MIGSYYCPSTIKVSLLFVDANPPSSPTPPCRPMEGLQGGERGGDRGGGDRGGGDTTRCGSGEEMAPGLPRPPGLTRAADTSLRIRGRGPSFDRQDWRQTGRRVTEALRW